MANKAKGQSMGTPIENHRTASWANINETKPISNVPIPSISEVENAKDYVDDNEK